MDQPKRTLAKTVTWRIIALVTTILVVYLYSKDITESLVIGVTANALKMVLYYVHERMWNRVSFGREKSIKAVERAFAGNKLIFFTAQKNASISDPIDSDLYEVGTVCKIECFLLKMI